MRKRACINRRRDHLPCLANWKQGWQSWMQTAQSTLASLPPNDSCSIHDENGTWNKWQQKSSHSTNDVVGRGIQEVDQGNQFHQMQTVHIWAPIFHVSLPAIQNIRYDPQQDTYWRWRYQRMLIHHVHPKSTFAMDLHHNTLALYLIRMHANAKALPFPWQSFWRAAYR